MDGSRRERVFSLAGLQVAPVVPLDGGVRVEAQTCAQTAACPCCTLPSRRLHSRYLRRFRDLPAHGRRVEIVAIMRRFRCMTGDCPRRILAKRLDPTAASIRARRTARLEGFVHHLGLALGGHPGEAIARRPLPPVSKDTLPRTVRRPSATPSSAPRVIGIDDRPWRKGHRGGTLICDLERREVIDLPPDREPATVAAWLAARPGLEIIPRDRGGGHGLAAAQGRPEAIQVADRWHLMGNAGAVFLMAVRRRMRDLRRAFGPETVDPPTLTAAERLRYEGGRRRVAEAEGVRALHADGVGLKEIGRRTGRSRKLVRDVIRGGASEPFRPRASSLEPWLDRLNAEWSEGCRNGAELWRRLQAAGFPGSLCVVTERATRRRRDDAAAAPAHCPGPRALARLPTYARDRLTRAQALIVATVERAAPDIVDARGLFDGVHALVRKRDGDGLGAWIDAALASPIASFANDIAKNRAAVSAAILQPWSNGRTEGQIRRLKTVKRQMGGRANIDLLKDRMMHASRPNAPRLRQAPFCAPIRGPGSMPFGRS